MANCLECYVFPHCSRAQVALYEDNHDPAGALLAIANNFKDRGESLPGVEEDVKRAEAILSLPEDCMTIGRECTSPNPVSSAGCPRFLHLLKLLSPSEQE